MSKESSPPITTFNPVLLLQQFRSGDVGNGVITTSREKDNREKDNREKDNREKDNREKDNREKDNREKDKSERDDRSTGEGLNSSRRRSNTLGNNARGHETNRNSPPNFPTSIPVNPPKVDDPLNKWNTNAQLNSSFNGSTYPISTNSSSISESGMIALLQRQVAEKVAENNKLLKMLEEANRSIALLHEDKRALEQALTLQSHSSLSPLPSSFPTHPSELSILRDRVAYLESALESALEAREGELGSDWNLGDLDVDPHPLPQPQPHPHPYPHLHPHPYSHSNPVPHLSPLSSSPPSSGYHSFTSSYSHPSELMETQHPPNGTTSQQHYPHNYNVRHTSQNGAPKNGPSVGKDSSVGKELDKRPPFISAISPHSSRFVKPSAGAKLQIPKAPPDASKPVIRIDLSTEMTTKTQPKVKKKNSVYSSRTLPVSVSPVTIANITNT